LLTFEGTGACRAKEKRLMEEGLRKVKGLGSTDPDADDISSWVAKSREDEMETKRVAERAAAAKLSTMYDEEVLPLLHMTINPTP
jgi:hypothetical protein